MKKFERTLQIIILSVFILYSLFYKLNALSYRIWDEAHLSKNAYEMSKTGNLLVTTFDYKPDMDCTKPPLMIWAQALCIKAHGLNEFSIRFPAAVSAALTILFVFGFVLHITNNGWAALLSGIVLCTAKGYIGYHTSRYGEYDPMLTLFTTLALLSFYLYTEASGKQNRYLLLFFVALTLGILTKGVVILMFGPVLLLYLVLRRKLYSILTNRTFYTGMAIFSVFGAGYYFLREHFNPGYLKAIFGNELGGRYLQVNEGHNGLFSFYYMQIKNEKFTTWFWTLPAALVLFPFNRNKVLRRLSFFLFLCGTCFLLLLSLSASKLPWYDLPVYPLFAIIISLFTLQLADLASLLVPFISQKVALLFFIFVFSILPTYEIIPFIKYCDYNDDVFYSMSYYLRNKIRTGNSDLKNALYFDQGYIALAWDLYVDELNEKGMNIKRINMDDIDNLKSGNKIICNDEKADKAIETKYNYKIVEETGNTRLYLIQGLKSDS